MVITEYDEEGNEDCRSISTEDNKKTDHCVYITSLNGNIVNAINGVEYNIKHGSPESYQFYKVIISSGVIDPKGCISRSIINKAPVITYYDSPDQYSNYTNIKLSEKNITVWNNRKNLLFPNGIFSMRNYIKYKNNKTKKQ